MRLRAIALLLLIGAGCGRGAPGEPRDAVKRLFAALAARDCAAMTVELGGALGERVKSAGCEAALKSLGGMELERIEGASLDGRDRKAWLVRVRLRGKPEAALVRVEEHDGRWAVVSL